MIAYLALITLLLGPPVLSLIATFRRARYERSRGHSGRRARYLAAFSIAGLLVNLRLMPAILGATEGLGWHHAAAGGVAWLCLWTWIIVSFLPRVRRQRTARS
ncbi:MAG: hypothetical protein R3E44_09010 [Paracoccaceae bacterium]